MSDFINQVKIELKPARSTQKEGHIKTIDVRSVSAKIFRKIEDKSKENVLSLCTQLLEQHDWAMSVIAYDFAFRIKNQYEMTDFDLFEEWLEKYVRGWGDCDDFCTHAFGELDYQNTELAHKTILWTKRKEFWMRRASAVILIRSIFRGKYNEVNALKVADILMHDEHYLVLKGYGWMLKTISTQEPNIIFDYLQKNKKLMPRVSFRYALEKLSKEQRAVLME